MEDIIKRGERMKSKMEPRVVRREIVWEGKFLRIVRVIYLDKDGKERIWESAERKNRNVVAIVLYDRKERKFIFPEQYRVPVGGNVIGLVAGVCDKKGKTQKEIVIMESGEESGWEPQTVSLISENCTGSAGFGNELKTTFWGTDLKYVGKKKGHEEDGIKVHMVSRDTVLTWLNEQQKEGKKIEDNVFGNIAYVLRILEGEEQAKRAEEELAEKKR